MIGGAVARIDRVERTPDFLSGMLVDRHDACTLGTSGQQNQPLAIHQRRGGHAPGIDLRAVITRIVEGPTDFTGSSIKTEHVSHRAHRIDLAIADGGRGPRPGWVTDCVATGIFVSPQHFPGGCIEAQHAFGSADRVSDIPAAFRDGFPCLDREIAHIDAPFRDCRTGKAAADRYAPTVSQFLRQFVDNPRLAPHAIPLRPTPLRPILSPTCQGKQQQQDAAYKPDRFHAGIPARSSYPSRSARWYTSAAPRATSSN